MWNWGGMATTSRDGPARGLERDSSYVGWRNAIMSDFTLSKRIVAEHILRNPRDRLITYKGVSVFAAGVDVRRPVATACSKLDRLLDSDPVGWIGVLDREITPVD